MHGGVLLLSDQARPHNVQLGRRPQYLRVFISFIHVYLQQRQQGISPFIYSFKSAPLYYTNHYTRRQATYLAEANGQGE